MPRSVRLLSDGMAELLTSPGVAEAVLESGRDVESRLDPPVDTGELLASHEVRVVVEEDRARAYVTASAPHALVVEARTGYMSAAVGGGR